MDDLSEDGSVTCRHKGALLGHTSSCNGARQSNHICSNTWIPLPGDGRSFLILSRINLLFNFIFHLDSNHQKALQPSILNVSGEAEEHANTACFWCAGTWRAFWFHVTSSLHAASGLLSFLRIYKKREKIREMETKYWAGRERGRVREGGETQGIKKLITFSQTTVMPVFLEEILRKTKRSPIKCNQRDKENRVITLKSLTQ